MGASAGCARSATTTERAHVETRDVAAIATPARAKAPVAPPPVAPATDARDVARPASTPVIEARVTPASRRTRATAPTGPRIISVLATPAVIHAGETVAWDVRTTPDIVSVAANVTAYHLPLQRMEPGHFVLNFTVPSNVPAIFHGTYSLDVRGETASGASADRRVSLVFE